MNSQPRFSAPTQSGRGRRRFRRCGGLAAGIALVAVCTGCPDRTPVTPPPADSGFFRPGPVAPASMDARGIFPQGRTMHIGGYSVGSAPLKQLGGIVPMDLARQTGFTVAGPYYGSFEGSRPSMEAAAAMRLHVAAQLEAPPVLRFKKGEDPLQLRGARMAALPEDELRQWVGSCMDLYLTNAAMASAVSCWAISPEELRSWRAPELTYALRFFKAVNDHDPRRRPVYMYEPNNRTTDGLLKTGPGQGFVLEGAYVHNLGWDVRRALRINWAMDQMTAAAAKDGRVVVPGFELSQDMPGFTAKDIETDPDARVRLRRLLRHDVYLAVARGAKGFQVWSLFPFRPHLTTYLEVMRAYGEVFREFTASPLNLQEPILFGERRDDVAVEVVKGPPFISAPPKEGTLAAVEGTIDVQSERWPSVRLANIAHGTERILILVNSAADPVEVRLAGIPAEARLATVSGGDFARVDRVADGVTASLSPFAAVVLRITR